MPQPIEYPRHTTKPRARWSLCAAMGFALSLPGPILGFAIALVLGSIFHGQWGGNFTFFTVLFSPMALGLILSLRALFITSHDTHHIKGGGLAAAGIFCCGVWVTICVVLFAMIMSK